MEDSSPTHWRTLPAGMQPEGRGEQDHLWQRVQLGHGAWRDPTLFLFSVDYAFEAYLDGQLIYHFGKIRTDGKAEFPGWRKHFIALPPNYQGKFIYLRIYSDYHDIGVFGSSLLGSRAELQQDMLQRDLHVLLLSIVAMLFSLYPILVFLRNRNEWAYLFLGLFCAAMGIAYFQDAGLRQLIFDAPALLVVLSAIADIVACIAILSFFAAVLGGIHRRILSYVLIPHFLYGVFALATAPFDFPFFADAFPYFNVVEALDLCLLIGLSLHAGLGGNSDARILTLGFLLALPLILHDLIAGPLAPRLMPASVVILILAQGALLWRRQRETQRRVLAYSAELEFKNAELSRLDRLKDEFLTNTSHELKTPLNGIIGLADSLMEGAEGPVAPGVGNNLQLISASGRRLNSLINDILDFSRLKQRDILLHRRSVDLRAVAELCVQLCTPLLDGRPIKLENQCPDGLPRALADEDRLLQILLNLLGNALKFTDLGVVRIDAEIANDGMLELSVADTGIGISVEKQLRIFESFEQVDGSSARRHGGAGLGLAIANHLADLHGGKLRVESELGRGSRFTLSLPCAVHEDTESSVEWVQHGTRATETSSSLNVRTPATPESTYRLQGVTKEDWQAHVLVVDDEPVNVQVIANYLSVIKVRVSSARSSEGVFALLNADQAAPPDLLLLDVMLPGMNGLEICRRLRQRYSLAELPVLMLTARSQSQDLLNGFAAGANDYLPKPVEKAPLLARVNALLNMKRAAREQRELATLQQEIRLATQLQRSILPDPLPVDPRIEIQVFYLPKQSIGGDFYDFQHPGEGRLGVIIADVCGHGIPAAIGAAMLKIAFGGTAALADQPAEVLNQIRSTLAKRLAGQFITAAYAFVDLPDSSLSVSFAGHPPLMLLKAGSKEPLLLKPPGPVLAELPWSGDYNTLRTPLHSGDRIFMYTDGITEAGGLRGEEFGRERLIEFLVEQRDRPLRQFADDLLARLRSWSGQDIFEDDVTFVVMDVSD
ncbi:MAG: SpoIIE family protein phosphatase [Leptospirales bacterium]|nr:SpoIIE family protein phosphatase [Leptospirales bacterium]